MEPTPWAGTLFLGEGWAVYAGHVGATALHAHHAFQLARVCDGALSLRGKDDTSEVACDAAVIAPSVPHGVGAGASRGVMVYVDPDTLMGRRLRAIHPRRERASEWRDAGSPLRRWTIAELPRDWAGARDCVRRATDALGAHTGPALALHPALGRARAWLFEHLHREDLSLEGAASAAGLSAHRLSHLLNESLGIGLRPLVLWLRLHVAAREIARDEDARLSRAAAAAGFADAAHMTRTFRRMFGLAPSEVVGVVHWVMPPHP